MSKKKNKDKARLYDLASDSIVEVDQALANRLASNEHLFCVYLRAHYALMRALEHTEPIYDPVQLLTVARSLAMTPSDEYKKLAAKLLHTC